jgi:hypothetical protein
VEKIMKRPTGKIHKEHEGESFIPNSHKNIILLGNKINNQNTANNSQMSDQEESGKIKIRNIDNINPKEDITPFVMNINLSEAAKRVVVDHVKEKSKSRQKRL